MNGKKKSNFIEIVTVIVYLLVIVLAVGLVFKYTKAGDKIEDLINPAFRVEYDGVNYSGENNVITLPNDGQAQFKIKGTASYKVTLRSNVTPETDFTYEIGNTVYNFSQADLSKVFIGNDSIKNGDFYLNCLEDYFLESVLSKVHDGAEIKLNGCISYPYLLTFGNGTQTVSFLFGSNVRIELSESIIVF